MDLPDLYRQMARARASESAVAAGVVAYLRDGVVFTHRGSPDLVVRGVPLFRERLGKEDGLCGGRGGHIHPFSLRHLTATSGIVGASLPMAAGFAPAAKRLCKGAAGIAFTGDGAA